MSTQPSQAPTGEGASPPAPPDLPATRARDLAPDLSPKAAARAAVRVPMRALEVLLPAAADHWEAHTEYVHQVRVSTRRAAAALTVFACCYDAAEVAGTRRMLKRIRRAAGGARDCDVHLDLFRRRLVDAPEDERLAIRHLIDSLELQRIEAQEAIHRVSKKYPAKRVRRARKALAKSLHKPDRIGVDSKKKKKKKKKIRELRDLAAVVVPPAAAEVRRESEVTPRTEAQLHEVRIAVKRLRYACEIFYGSMPGDRQRSVKSQVIPLVDALGAMNDVCNVLIRLRDAGTDIDDPAIARSYKVLIERFEQQNNDACAAASAAIDDVLEHHVFEMLEEGWATSEARGKAKHNG